MSNLFIDCRFYLHDNGILECHFQDGRTITFSKETVQAFQKILLQILADEDDEDEEKEISDSGDQSVED